MLMYTPGPWLHESCFCARAHAARHQGASQSPDARTHCFCQCSWALGSTLIACTVLCCTLPSWMHAGWGLGNLPIHSSLCMRAAIGTPWQACSEIGGFLFQVPTTVHHVMPLNIWHGRTQVGFVINLHGSNSTIKLTSAGGHSGQSSSFGLSFGFGHMDGRAIIRILWSTRRKNG